MDLGLRGRIANVAASRKGLGEAMVQGQPEEFANLAVFLASESASYITGASIAVDGGFVKGIN